MGNTKPMWCGVEVTEEEYARLAKEYLRQFVEAPFVPVEDEATGKVRFVCTEPARVGKIK